MMENASEPTERPDFEEKLKAFVEICNAVIARHWKAAGFTYAPPDVCEIDPGGKKYVRIVRKHADGTGGSAHCFVERATGNILKCDGWKRPAKHARGNIYDGSPGDCMGPSGAAYLK